MFPKLILQPTNKAGRSCQAESSFAVGPAYPKSLMDPALGPVARRLFRSQNISPAIWRVDG